MGALVALHGGSAHDPLPLGIYLGSHGSCERVKPHFPARFLATRFTLHVAQLVEHLNWNQKERFESAPRKRLR